MAVTEDNSCAFYVSDYHFEMIILPYINENLKENKNVYIFTENNLENTINVLINKINIENKIKENILKINWKNEDENKYNKLLEDTKESIIFVKGNTNYIEKINKNLDQIKKYKKIEVVDCYNLEEITDKTENIANKHKKVIVTKNIK